MTWTGARALAGGKAYIDAAFGQLHIRDIGPRSARPPLLLLHQSPQFMVEFAAVQNSLAARGLRSIAVDTPGYGMSDHPHHPLSIEDLADNLLAVADVLALPSVVVAGHHTGACIAAAFAARHAPRVSGAILHGCPVYTEQDRERAAVSAPWEVGALVADGTHLLQLFRRIPPRDAGETLIRTWMSAALLLQGPDMGHMAVRRYDMEADLRRIRSPGLIMSEIDDVTHRMDQRARALRPDFSYRVLAERGTCAVMTKPDDWADLAVEFLRQVVLF